MDKVAVLVDIRSIHNVGSVFRTADGAGFSKIFLCGVTPSPLDRFGRPDPRLAKVALGAEKTLAWESFRRAADAIRKLKAEGYVVLAVEQAPGSVPLGRFKSKKKKLALVLGEETKGISPALLKKCDAVLEIPMLGKKESLNVSVAFGIAAYHFLEENA